jgi:hypothetical protein
MKCTVKYNFHDKIENKNYKPGDQYETEDKERAIHLAGLGLIEFETNQIEYETKVIKTKGRRKDENPD